MTRPVHREGPVARWDPFREFQNLYDRMGQLWQAAPGDGGLGTGGAWAPLADVEETEDAYVIELDLPGVRKDQMTIEVLDSELAVHGRIEEKERTGMVRRQTRRFGKFDYRTSLPADADAEHIGAVLADGVLSVRVPKVEKTKPRRIDITD